MTWQDVKKMIGFAAPIGPNHVQETVHPQVDRIAVDFPQITPSEIAIQTEMETYKDIFASDFVDKNVLASCLDSNPARYNRKSTIC